MSDKKRIKVVETKVWLVNEDDLESILENGISDKYEVELEDSTLTVSFRKDKHENT